MRLWILLLAFSCFDPSAASVFAHDSLDRHPILNNSAVQKLELFLETERAELLRAEATSVVAREAGELLLSAVYSEVVVELKNAGPPSAFAKSAAAARGALKRFNPVALGRWVLNAARVHGPALAIAYGVSEVLEQTGVLLAAKYPQLVFLLPFYLTHTSDVLVVGAFVAAPKIRSALSRWKRHGGWRVGASGYYRHLARQRQVSPIDWSVVLDRPEFETVSFAVVAESAIERRLPRALKILFSPRVLAQREESSVPTLGLWELEAVARRNGVALFAFEAFKAEPQIYLRLLLRELEQNRDARRELAAKLALLLTQASARNNGSEAGEGAQSPDLVAERWLWQLRLQRDSLKQAAAAQAKGPTRSQRKQFRQLDQLLDADRGLSRLAATSFEAGADADDWRALSEALLEAKALFTTIESELTPHAPCEALLLP